MVSLTVMRTVELIKTSYIKVSEKGKQNMGNICEEKKLFAEPFETAMILGLPITFLLSGLKQFSKYLILAKIRFPTLSYEKYNLRKLEKAV